MTHATNWLLVLCFLGIGATGSAAADLAADERACQVGRGRAVYDMIAAEGACIRRCRERPGADCRLPDGAGVARCLDAATSRALRRVFGRPCRRDCPECYGGCGADVAAGEVAYSTGLVTAFVPLVFCASAASNAEVRCMDRVARYAQADGGTSPSCHGDLAGADWIGVVRSAVDLGRPVIFCASPSGAFVER